MHTKIFIGACHHFDGDVVRGVVARSKPITRATFLRHADLDTLPKGHELRALRGSRPGYFLERFTRSTLPDGRKVHILTWSGVEHFFGETQ